MDLIFITTFAALVALAWTRHALRLRRERRYVRNQEMLYRMTRVARS
jgi:hypothetical protein